MFKIEDLCVSYDRQTEVIHHVNMNFGDYASVGLIGANGSGKSTIFAAIVGLIKPTRGQIIYGEQPISYKKADLYQYRQEVGIVFQEPDQQIFYAIVEDDVAFALKNLGLSAEIIAQRLDEAFDILEIQHLRKRPIQYLSYGQKKRVAIASVLVLKTNWVLLDEPTAGLDPKGRQQMLKIIQRLISKGTKVILSSHDMDLMYEACEYLYVLNNGKVVNQGVKAEVFLDKEILMASDLEQPWLVKIHQQLKLPLYQNEAEFLSNHQTEVE